MNVSQVRGVRACVTSDLKLATRGFPSIPVKLSAGLRLSRGMLGRWMMAVRYRSPIYGMGEIFTFLGVPMLLSIMSFNAASISSYAKDCACARKQT